MNETFLGIDLGGTGLKLGELTRDGELLRQREVSSGYLSQRQALELIGRELESFLAKPAGKPAALGLGLVGRIDGNAGLWLEIDHDRSEKLPVAALLRERFGLPCFADNDVRSAARAEGLFGGEAKPGNWVYLNVGTGIAAAVTVNGRLVTGGHWNAGEVGHTGSGIAFRAPCACGRPDCVESVASGMGIDLCARLLAPEYPDTRLRIPEDGRVSAAEVFALYREDALCRRLTDNAARALANLLMNLTRFCDPEQIVLGGGMMTGGFLLEKIKEHLNPYTMRYVVGGATLSRLDPRVIGILGAAANAMTGMEEQKC